MSSYVSKEAKPVVEALEDMLNRLDPQPEYDVSCVAHRGDNWEADGSHRINLSVHPKYFRAIEAMDLPHTYELPPGYSITVHHYNRNPLDRFRAKHAF